MASSKSLMRRSCLDERLVNMQYLEIESDKVELSPLMEYAAGGSCILRIGVCTPPDFQRKHYARMNVGVKVFKTGYTEEERVKTAMRFVEELEVWAILKHENLLPLSGYYIARDLSEAWLISEWQHNGNIQEYTCEKELGVRLWLLRNVLKGLDYLHSMRPPILHRDIKPGNVLIGGNPPRAMLCDFGLCKSPGLVSAGLSRGDSTETPDAFHSGNRPDRSSGRNIFTSQSDDLKGTFRYMAPELFQETPPPYSEDSDMWAWACTAHEVVSGETPYGWCTTEPKVLQAMNEGRLPWTKIPTEGSWDLIQKIFHCWEKNPQSRPSAERCQGGALYVGEPIQPVIGIPGSGPNRKDIDGNAPQLLDSMEELLWLRKSEQTIRILSVRPKKGPGEWSVRIARPRVDEHSDTRTDVISPWYDVPYSRLPTFLQEYIHRRAPRFYDGDLHWITWSLHHPLKVQLIALYFAKRASSISLEWSTLPRLDILLRSLRFAGLEKHLAGFPFTREGGTLTLWFSRSTQTAHWQPDMAESFFNADASDIALSFSMSSVPQVEDPGRVDEDDQASKALLKKVSKLRHIFANGVPPEKFYHFCAVYFILEAPGALRRLQDWTRQSEFRHVEIDPPVKELLYGREDSPAWNDTEPTDTLHKLIADMVPIIRDMINPYLNDDDGGYS